MSSDGPPFEVGFEVSEPLARRMLRVYLWRRMGGWAIGAGLAALFALWGISEPSIRVPSAFALGLAAALALAWARAWRGALRRARKRTGDRVAVVFDAEGLAWTGSDAQARLAWSDLKRLDRAREFWFLELEGESRSVTLPAELLSDPLRCFVVERARAARARIV